MERANVIFITPAIYACANTTTKERDTLNVYIYVYRRYIFRNSFISLFVSVFSLYRCNNN